MHPRQSASVNKNAGVLLTEFFELYGVNFNYEHVGISVRATGSYFSKEDSNWADRSRSDKLLIENPLSPADEVAGGSFAIAQVRQCFEHAYHMMVAAMLYPEVPLRASTILSSIIRIPREIIEYRYVCRASGKMVLAEPSLR
jgi:DNA polymerase sigma